VRFSKQASQDLSIGHMYMHMVAILVFEDFHEQVQGSQSRVSDRDEMGIVHEIISNQMDKRRATEDMKVIVAKIDTCLVMKQEEGSVIIEMMQRGTIAAFRLNDSASDLA
jgi:hypothetical protein